MNGQHLLLTCVFTWAQVGGQAGEGLCGLVSGKCLLLKVMATSVPPFPSAAPSAQLQGGLRGDRRDLSD